MTKETTLHELADSLEAAGNSELDKALDTIARRFDPLSINGCDMGLFTNAGALLSCAAAVRSRPDGVLRSPSFEAEQRCYHEQLDTINATRAERGEQPLTYTQFLAGGD